MAGLIDQLSAALEPAALCQGDAVPDARRSDWSGEAGPRPSVWLRPSTTEQVSAILTLCHTAGQPVAVQGGLSGLCGGATPGEREWILSLDRLIGVETLDPEAMTVTVKAGTPLQTVQEAADAAGLMFPLDLGARGSCQIGGAIATNAGGNRVIRYGMTRDLVLGLEAVLPDGRVISQMTPFVKNNTGYDLKQLFVGSEGTLGIVTRAVLRLAPPPRHPLSAFCAFDSFDGLKAFLGRARRALDSDLLAFEALWQDYYRLAVTHAPTAKTILPVDFSHYALIEAAGPGSDDDHPLHGLLEQAFEDGLLADAAVARSAQDAADFWAVREAVGDLGPVLSPFVPFDVSLALGDTQAFIDRVRSRLAERAPRTTACFFGHLGDGNIHIFVSLDERTDAKTIDDLVYAEVAAFGGAISAEHGIGTHKKPYLHHSRSPAELDLMRTLKGAVDPKGLLNPGRVI